ncbi:MAG: histidine--tRNA ligase [Gammaproteobacteria bacterium]
MSTNIQPVRGMNDILPDQTPVWQYLEATVRDLLTGYGYREIRFPLVEKTELFSRSIGEVTDIVEKEMYTFEDRNGTSLSLRPEGTASCVRAGLSNGLLHNQIQRLWYAGPMFRHERPQKGRYRQFHQIGAEAFGMAGPEIDAELILVTARLWRLLGLSHVRLEINSLGTAEARRAYRSKLQAYFAEHLGALDEDSRRRLETNPLRILDSKNPDMAPLIEGAPSLIDHLDPESAAHFADLRAILDDCGVDYTVNPRLVRGLDYYSRTVFEWLTDQLGAQDAICSGGRYDYLVEQLGGRSTPAIGWAMGMERLIALLEVEGGGLPTMAPHAYLVLPDDGVRHAGLSLAEQLRDVLPGLRLEVDCTGSGFKAQMKKADRSGAKVALILGPEEFGRRAVAVKPLRSQQSQVDIPWDELDSRLPALIGGLD